MKKIVITGPESSGKTTLAAQLAAHFGAVWVPEFSRQYLAGLGRLYTFEDLLEIANGQIELEDKLASTANDLLFLDTSLEVLKIWSEVRYGRCHPKITASLFSRLPDQYLLCHPDLPWEPDPLRENPNDRDALLALYKEQLILLGIPYGEVCGIGQSRFNNAIHVVNQVLNSQ